MELSKFKAWELKQLLEKKAVSCEKIIKSLHQKIKKNSKINSYITVLEKESEKIARNIDEKLAKGEKLGLLGGVPIAIKDNICVKGCFASCGSKILSDFVSPYDATVVEWIKKEDGVILGKTNMDEFGMGSSNENSFFGEVKNPNDLTRVPGGSSGGSAAAVASDMTIMALGSDTGGSVRQPASFCGVVGLKPTYGLVSRYGLVAFASSLDQIGCITKDVKDCALLLSVIAGYDPRDSTSINLKKKDYAKILNDQLENIKIGIPKEYFQKGLEPEVKEAVMNGIKLLKREGLKSEQVSLPHTDKAIAAYYVLCTAEASSNLARYDGTKYGYRSYSKKDLAEMYAKTRSEGFGEEVKRRIILGTYVLSKGYYDAYYAKAQKVRTVIKDDFDQAFKKVDVLITPTSPSTAFKLKEKMDDPLTMYLSDIYTTSANLVGIPAISVPCGKDSQGLPIGLQIMGKPLSEDLLLRVAYALEQNLKK
jgi:aspartyl-tRNA(Asn)/glutamyl-tRNA(Gln) amidotransferase subunit A